MLNLPSSQVLRNRIERTVFGSVSLECCCLSVLNRGCVEVPHHAARSDDYVPTLWGHNEGPHAQ